MHVCTKVAYVPQSAFIYNATVRENILFGLPFDQQRYAEAIRASAVGPDIDNMPGERPLTVPTTVASVIIVAK